VSLFNVLRARTRFRRYRGRRVLFSCYARPDAFSAVTREPGPVFRLCSPGLVFGSTKGVGSRLNVLRARTRFQRYRGRRVPFSCYARPDAFSAVTRETGPVFKLCSPELVFDRTEGVGSSFPVLRAETHFWRYRAGRVPFACFARPDSFSTVPRASGPVFML
jgi:hypothetical protein